MPDLSDMPGIFGGGPNDWYTPDPRAMPRTSDHPSISSTTPQSLMEQLAPPVVPPGSLYSPSRNVWLTSRGEMVPAGDFRPLPPDSNTYDANDETSFRMSNPSQHQKRT